MADPTQTPAQVATQIAANRAKYMEQFYVYGLNFLALAPAASVAQTINVEAAAHFKLTKMAFLADIAAAGTTDATRVLPNVTVLIVDTASGRQLMNIAVPLCNIAGTGGLPFILPMPIIYPAKSNVSVTLANYDAANTYNIRLAFIGVRLALQN